MKRKNLLLACMCAVFLTGCGNHNESAQAAGESASSSTAEMGTETAGISEGTGEAGTESAGTPEGAETAGTSEDAGETGVEAAEAENAETPERVGTPGTESPGELGGNAAEGTAQKPAFVFGDKATMNNNVNGRELPIYCVETEEKKIALSFDAAWGNEDTAELLAILKEHDLHVTFFMTGGWVESYPEDVKAILEAGHDLGNHSENHKNMSELSDEEKKEEILSVHQKVKEITGYDMFLFRPPYGDYDNALIDVLKDCGYYGIQWDVDSLDWKNEGVEAILETVTEHKSLGNGSIILCHNGGEYTAEALDELILALEAQGYEIVPVSELIYPDNYHMDIQGRQIADE